MGILGRLLGIWKPAFSRPFFKNETTEDFKEWFGNAPRWKRLDSRIADALIERLKGNPIFEVLVHLSWDADLIKEYAYIPRSFDGRNFSLDSRALFYEAIYANINQILYRIGGASRDRAMQILQSAQPSQDEFKKHCRIALDAFECTINLQPAFLAGYLQLAALKLAFNKNEEAREICQKGLAQADKIRKDMELAPPDLRDSFIEADSKLRELLAQI
jgi:hypothetical protein